MSCSSVDLKSYLLGEAIAAGKSRVRVARASVWELPGRIGAAAAHSQRRF